MCPISAVMLHVQIVLGDVNTPIYSQAADTGLRRAHLMRLVYVCVLFELLLWSPVNCIVAGVETCLKCQPVWM